MGGKPSVLTTDSDAGSSAPVSVASASESHVGAVPSGGPPPPPTVTSTGPQHTKEQQAAFEAWVTARFDKDTRFIGLENYGNTCYCNSVIQALFNSPLRRAVAEWSDKHKKKKMQAHGGEEGDRTREDKLIGVGEAAAHLVFSLSTYSSQRTALCSSRSPPSSARCRARRSDPVCWDRESSYSACAHRMRNSHLLRTRMRRSFSSGS